MPGEDFGPIIRNMGSEPWTPDAYLRCWDRRGADGRGTDRVDGQGPGRARPRRWASSARCTATTCGWSSGPAWARRLRERVELSDVVQEALVEVVRQFPQFTGQNEAALVGWLRRLVGQKLADLGRYHSRAKRSAGGPDAAAGRPLGRRAARAEASGGGRPAARHARPEPDQPERGRQPPRADRPAGRRPGRPARARGRGPLALPRRGPLVRGDRRAAGPQPQVDPGHLGPRPEEPEAVARRARPGGNR